MTTITINRATVEQALEALRHVVRQAQENLVPTIHYGPVNDVMNRLAAALAQRQPDPVDEYRKGFIAGQIDMRDREQAEPTVKESLPVESVVAEAATTQQQLADTPPSDYRRSYLDGYFDGFAIGKREGRIEAEDKLAQQAEPGEPVALKHRHEWFRTGGMEPGQLRCIHCGVWGQEQSDPQIEDRLARHGIPMPEGDPK